MYHYWVEGPDGSHVSENATVVTSLSSHTATSYDMKNPVTGHESSHVLVLRPELNCLQQGEFALTKALLDHHLVPPPTTPLLTKVVKEEHSEGTYGRSDRFVLQDQFLDEFIFKEEVKDGFFVEAGADDFLSNTNTLLFELLHGWTGLLIEPVAMRFEQG